MSTRRIGAAWATAHRPASTVRPPMLTSSGLRPRPITEVLKPTLTLTLYAPGLNSRASRRVPNWLVSWAANTESSELCTDAVLIDGS